MNLTIVGAGYVGLVSGAVFADKGNTVTFVDNNKTIIDNLNNGKIHIFEPGLKERLFKNRDRITFTTDLDFALGTSQIIFLTVGTPSDTDGKFNLNYLISAVKDIAKYLLNKNAPRKIIVCKSTVPQGTSEILQNILNENKFHCYSYVANPETLAEGTAIHDFSNPERIIIGTTCDYAFKVMKELYHPFNFKKDKIIRGTPADAELAKLFSNTALAARIAMVNEFSLIADVTKNADMDTIRKWFVQIRGLV